jgi:hypothetical protein
MLRFTTTLCLFVASSFVVACSSSDDSTGNNADADHIADADHFDNAPQDFGPPPDTGSGDSPVVDTGSADGLGDSAIDAPVDSVTDAILDGDAADVCTASGGTVTTALCCAASGDFPNQCLVGACSCAPSSSHEVKICNCGGGRCWDGSHCVLGP